MGWSDEDFGPVADACATSLVDDGRTGGALSV
jgi:hypothetical protein